MATLCVEKDFCYETPMNSPREPTTKSTAMRTPSKSKDTVEGAADADVECHQLLRMRRTCGDVPLNEGAETTKRELFETDQNPQ